MDLVFVCTYLLYVPWACNSRQVTEKRIWDLNRYTPWSPNSIIVISTEWKMMFQTVYYWLLSFVTNFQGNPPFLLHTTPPTGRARSFANCSVKIHSTATQQISFTDLKFHFTFFPNPYSFSFPPSTHRNCPYTLIHYQNVHLHAFNLFDKGKQQLIRTSYIMIQLIINYLCYHYTLL